MAKDLNPLAAEKSRLRRIFKDNWDVMKDSEKKHQDLQSILVNFLKAQSGIWCGYHALASEINLQPVFQQTTHLRWAFPAMTGKELRFFIPGEKGYAQGDFGIQEPVIENAELISPQMVAGFLIPGLGFDQFGNRLGKGLGFYDRALLNVRGIKVGVSFSDFQIEKLPSEEWDVRMDFLATEVGLQKF